MSKCHTEIDHNMNSKFKCDHCKTKFAHKHKLKGRKEKDHILNSDSKCVCCLITYRHMFQVTWKDQILMSEFKCDCCITKSQQTRIKRSHRERQYPHFGFQICLLCRHKLKSQVEKNHNPNSKFKCDQCITKFTHKHKLKSHGEKNYIFNLNSKCVYCMSYTDTC